MTPESVPSSTWTFVAIDVVTGLDFLYHLPC